MSDPSDWKPPNDPVNYDHSNDYDRRWHDNLLWAAIVILIVTYGTILFWLIFR